ncbi:hypothetical protein EXIGLDRAFT_732744 [Exidia glandulosa HHB12029]|uniref:Uncharacterized protein n=1 Tax=Exidia glandulosa HHB12029 TaxID=1314781 RepID=A0A165BEY9_EXIGL|nr:hypothetical protein EXIGLDRAFT_732744 [Exidia glandulosa HHB12029]
MSLNWAMVDVPDRDRFYALSRGGSSNPVKFWFVGVVNKLWLFDSNGEPAKSISVNLGLLDNRDVALANNILRQHSKPHGAAEDYPDMRFSRWMTVRQQGESKPAPELFTDVYDARDGLRLPRLRMRQLPANQLTRGNLVLIDASVQRWHPRKEEGKTVWSEYKAYFALNYIALLNDSPPPNMPGQSLPQGDIEIEL